MRAMATCHGGALEAPRPYPPHLSRFTHPILRRSFDCKDNLKPIRTTTMVGRKYKLGARVNAKTTTQWSVEPEEVDVNGGKCYLDEQDVVTFLDPPKELIPLDPSSFNPASYLWKKIEDIPVERRHNLLSLLNPRLISRAWAVAGGRYDDPKLAKKSASSVLSNGNAASVELWRCRTSGAPLPIAWMNIFQKAIFRCTDGKAYGRLIGTNMVIVKSLSPLYFSVREFNEVMPTEHPCDMAYVFGDGLLNLPEYPRGFPKPGKHPWPLNDEVVIYIRHVGPGVVVGQAWQEGRNLQQLPKKLCNEILMVKDSFDHTITAT